MGADRYENYKTDGIYIRMCESEKQRRGGSCLVNCREACLCLFHLFFVRHQQQRQHVDEILLYLS